MTDPNILFKNLAKNIHYTTGTEEEGYPALDKEFYGLIDEIKQMTVPLKVKSKPGQLQQIMWGLDYIANGVRTNIVNDFLSILDKFTIPQLILENYLGVVLYISIVSKDKSIEENVLKLIPETLTPVEKKDMELTGTLGFNLFLYYYLKGDKVKGEPYLKDILTQSIRELDLKYVKISANDKKEIEKIIKKLKSTIVKKEEIIEGEIDKEELYNELRKCDGRHKVDQVFNKYRITDIGKRTEILDFILDDKSKYAEDPKENYEKKAGVVASLIWYD
jgi:hypothetical protein